MGLNIGKESAGKFDSFQKLSMSRIAYKHLFVVETHEPGLEMPSLFVLRGVFPYNEVQTFPIERDNSNIYYPEITDVGDLEVEFYETMDNSVFDFFDVWSSKIRNKEGIFNLPDSFKRSVYAFRLDTMGKGDDNSFTKVFGLEYSGCFPKRISDYPFDMSDPNVVNLSITFSVDGVRRLGIGEGVNEPNASTNRTVPSFDPEEARFERGAEIESKKSRLPVSSDLFDEQAMAERSGKTTFAEKRERDFIKGLKAKGDAYATSLASKSTALWVEALIKAAARTGINLAKREAFYMAYAASKKYGDVLSGTRVVSNVVRGTL